jgi:hypothetical protein
MPVTGTFRKPPHLIRRGTKDKACNIWARWEHTSSRWALRPSGSLSMAQVTFVIAVLDGNFRKIGGLLAFQTGGPRFEDTEAASY